MVSLKTIGTLGIIAVGAALFVAAGGAKGLGTKIGGAVGGGFSDFSKAIGGAFTTSLFGGNANADTGPPATGGEGQIGPPPRTGTEEFDPFGNLEGNFKGLQNILDSINNFFRDPFGARAQQLTDIRLVGIQEQSLGRKIDLTRSVAGVRLQGGTPVLVTLGGKDRLFATQESADSFTERFNR